MKWFKKLLGFKDKEEVPQEVIEPQFADGEPPKTIDEVQEEPIKQETPTAQEDKRPILRDQHGEDLICKLCENVDNETGEYTPIRLGDQRKFNGESWHKKCLRVFQKEAKRGNLV